MTTTIDYFDIGEVKPSEDTMEKLMKLASESSELSQQIADEQIETEKKIKRMEEINRNRLPEIMQSLGMSSFKLADGSELLIEEKLNASISVANREKAYAWLDDHGFGGIIKTVLKSNFSRDEREKAEEARKMLAEAGFDAETESSIHAATLKSFVKERLAAAADVIETVEHDGFDDEEKAPSLPLDIFSVFEFKEAKIKAPKVSKKSVKK